jgi:outer membrane protein TolC
MTNRRLWAVAHLLTLLALAMYGAPAAAASLRLSEAVRLALAQHPSVRQAEAQLAQAESRLRQARAAWFPTLRLAGSLYQYEEPMAAWPIHGFDLTRIPPFDETLMQGGLQIDYTLFDGGAREARVRQAGRLRDAGQAAFTNAEQRLIARVVAAYLSVRADEELLAAHRQRRAAVDAERDRVAQLRAVGRAADVDVARAEAALAGADADWAQAQAALEVARRDLARLIGASADTLTVMPVAEPAAAKSLDSIGALSEQVLAQSAEVESARLRLVAAEAGRSAARGARWPSVNLRGAWSDLRDANGHRTDEWNAAVLVGLPLFTGGAVGGAIAEADAGRNAAAEDWRLAQERAAAQLDQTLALRQESRARIASLERAVASLEEVARIEQLRLSTGSDTQAEYLRAEADLLAARAGLINARHAAVQADVELARLLGELDMAWVEHNLESNR